MQSKVVLRNKIMLYEKLFNIAYGGTFIQFM